MLFLLVCSFVFIGYMNIMYLLLMLPAVIFNYLIARAMNHDAFTGTALKDAVSPTGSEAIKNRKLLLATGVIFDIVFLGIYKYTNFFIETINDVFSKDMVTINIIIPLGISFYTFKQISFLVDYYRDSTLKCSLQEYLLYICFFPQFIQGPIVLQSEFIPQLRDDARKKADPEYIAKGLYRFILGLTKKVLIADTISRAVDDGYRYMSDLGKMALIILILGYTLQIYFDFSGYSDMAIGVGHMFHIDLPENFDSPYKAVSIEDFWDRWHITLTRFFTRYVYIPLGGNRKGKLRTYANILFVFLLSGLWHGADKSFVLWGLMHGIAMLLCRIISDITSFGTKELKRSNIVVRSVMTLITFLYVNIAWVLFRAETIYKAQRLFDRLMHVQWTTLSNSMFERFEDAIEVTMLIRLDIIGLNERYPGFVLLVLLIILTLVCFFASNSRQITESWISRMKDEGGSRRVGAYVLPALLLLWCVFGLSGVTTFIYWSF